MNNEKELRHRYGWTPAPTKPAYSQTNVSLAHKGRDIESLMRYHEAHKKPVGYWEDAPRGMKFGESANGRPAGFESASEGSSPSSPATTPQSADGPWPKWFEGPALPLSRFLWTSNTTFVQLCCGHSVERSVENGMARCMAAHGATEKPIDFAWLEQNGHKDVAAQLRGKAATGGGRVWTGLLGNDVASKRACVLIGGIGYCRVRGNWHHLGEQKGEPTGEKVELFGPERDAILAECRKAMGLDTSTVRVTISTAPRADVDCKTRCELKQAYVKIEMATGLIIPCDETDPDKIGYVR